MDDRIQDWINGLAGQQHLLDVSMKLVAKDLVFLTPLLLLALWFWPASSTGGRAFDQRLAAATALGCLLALALAAGVAELYVHSRPFVSDASTRLLISHAADNGFPSDHTSFAVAVGGVIVWWKRGLGIVCLALGTLEGVARIYVGVHWPSDVLAGMGVGLAAGAVGAATVPLLVAPQRWAGRFLPPLLVSKS